ncbi:hypothetical protein SO802_030995 [Lithocarpus litseifolius]|uniref:Uncharacterized protein n=1 Tax=Lithocarpus litseifolius TaxID=425828 RepID=A0AAW2BMM7_9ROSI
MGGLGEIIRFIRKIVDMVLPTNETISSMQIYISNYKTLKRPSPIFTPNASISSLPPDTPLVLLCQFTALAHGRSVVARGFGGVTAALDNEDVIKGFFVFDSFNDAEQCHYIDLLIDLSPKDLVSFRVLQGHLRIFQRPCCPSPPDAYYFSVYEVLKMAGRLQHRGGYLSWQLQLYCGDAEFAYDWNSRITVVQGFKRLEMHIMRGGVPRDIDLLPFLITVAS